MLSVDLDKWKCLYILKQEFTVKLGQVVFYQELVDQIVFGWINSKWNDYMHDGKNFIYYDTFKINLKPRIVSKKGTTKIHTIGFGYANTGQELKCKYQAASRRPINCNWGVCIKQANI